MRRLWRDQIGFAQKTSRYFSLRQKPAFMDLSCSSWPVLVRSALVKLRSEAQACWFRAQSQRNHPATQTTLEGLVSGKCTWPYSPFWWDLNTVSCSSMHFQRALHTNTWHSSRPPLRLLVFPTPQLPPISSRSPDWGLLQDHWPAILDQNPLSSLKLPQTCVDCDWTWGKVKPSWMSVAIPWPAKPQSCHFNILRGVPILHSVYICTNTA